MSHDKHKKTDKSCGECRFYMEAVEGAEYGSCCRYPPSEPSHIIRDEMRKPGYPLVSADQDWCGEFRLDREKAKKDDEDH